MSTPNPADPNTVYAVSLAAAHSLARTDNPCLCVCAGHLPLIRRCTGHAKTVRTFALPQGKTGPGGKTTTDRPLCPGCARAWDSIATT